MPLGVKTPLQLPVSLKAVTSVLGVASKESTRTVRLSVLLDPALDTGFLASAKECLRPATEDMQLHVALIPEEIPINSPARHPGPDPQPLLQAQPALFGEGSDLLIVLADSSPAIIEVMAAARTAAVPAVVLTRDLPWLKASLGEAFFELDPLTILAAPAPVKAATTALQAKEDAEALVLLFERLGSWIIRYLSELTLSFARNLAFVRRIYVKDRIHATSLQNAAIAAAFFIPGADLPALTMNQMKMFLQIAAAYGEPIDTARIKELAVLVASGMGCRALARRVVGLVPVFGWAVKAGIGYGATFALGEAAELYFRHLSENREDEAL